MSRLTSNRKFSTMGPVLGERPSRLCGISDVSIGRYSRLPAVRLVRFGTQVLDPPASTTTHATVASATLDAGYRGHEFHVTAWQPQGKPAFVFVVALKDRQWIQPDVAEAADLDEVLRNAVAFVEQVLDSEAEQGG